MKHWIGVMVMCVPVVAAAGKHTMHWIHAETIHIANQGGAINRHDEATIAVDLLANDKIAITDAGTRNLHNLYKTYSSDDTTTWANVWIGTYKISGDVMHAELTLKDRKCSKTKSYSDAAGKTEPCDPIDKAIKLHCAFHEIPLQTDPGKPADAPMLWSCQSDEKLGETPMPWVFGGTPVCIEADAGRSGTSYRRCPRQAPATSP
jgi:hypothetical protein